MRRTGAMDNYFEGAGKLFIISGPSGTGKGTICKEVAGDTDIVLSVSATTRPPRKGEVDGVNYYFLSEKEFVKCIDEDGFLEHAQVYGNFYGTPKKNVMECLSSGKDVLLEIDMQGAMQVKKNYPCGIFIFILPPSMKELRKRITGRGTESKEAIDLRLSQTLKEIEYIDQYDYCVVNGELGEAVKRVKAIILSEHSRVTKDVDSLIRKYEEE